MLVSQRLNHQGSFCYPKRAKFEFRIEVFCKISDDVLLLYIVSLYHP